MSESNHSARHRTAQTFRTTADIIGGQTEGERFVRDLVEFSVAPDALAIRIREIAGHHSRLTGFCRALQKFIERAQR